MPEASIHEKAGILRDSVFAANDGIITTFAVVAGSAGASLSTKIVVILGLVSLIADGFAMASGNYLGVKSETEYQKAGGGQERHGITPVQHGLITFFSFVLAGFLPLIPYVLGIEPKFYLAIFLVGLSLFIIGALRGMLTKRSPLLRGFEMLLIGGFAALEAYGVGFLAKEYFL